MTTLEHIYRYRDVSALEESGGGTTLRLATSGGVEENPHFFTGSLLAPKRSADFLLALYEVVRSRFYLPPAMLQRILREADPVVTCDGERLRFEVFSSCCSAHARVDFLPGALEGERVRPGCTNVDFNPPLRAALARMRDDDSVALRVGREAVEIERAGEVTREQKVRLPQRWVRAFLEIQSYLRSFEPEPRLRVSGVEALRFLRSIPRGRLGAATLRVTQQGGALRLTQRPSGAVGDAAASVSASGAERLRLLLPLARHASELRVYGSSSGRVSGWQIVAPEMRFLLVLSPEVSRGFSGEGQGLEPLLDGAARPLSKQAQALLGWQGSIDPKALAGRLGCSAALAERALAVLGTQALVGYDVEERAYFHRELPFALGEVERFQPRLRGARKLVEEGAVGSVEVADGVTAAYVAGSGAEHRVRWDAAAGSGRCTCRWHTRHGGERGPCKHLLALRLAMAEA